MGVLIRNGIEYCGSGCKRELLWTNTDTTVSLSGNTTLFELPLEEYNKYEFFLITYMLSTAETTANSQLIIARAAGTGNGNNAQIMDVLKEGTTYHYHGRRIAYSYNSQAFVAARCTYLKADNSTAEAADKIIPYQIYGIKM